MKNTILQRFRNQLITMGVIIAVFMAWFFFISISDMERSENLRSRYLQSFTSLNTAMNCITETTSQGMVAITSANPNQAGLSRLLFSGQEYINKFSRELNNSLLYYSTVEKKRRIEDASDKYAEYVRYFRTNAGVVATDLNYVQMVTEKEKEITALIHQQIEIEKEEINKSINDLNQSNKFLYISGLVFLIMIITYTLMSYVFYIRVPMKKEINKYSYYLELLRTDHGNGSPAKIDSGIEFSGLFNRLGEIIYTFRNKYFNSIELHGRKNSLMQNVALLFGKVNKVADEENVKFKRITGYLENAYDEMKSRDERINKVTTTISETSSAASSIKNQTETILISVNKISNSAAEAFQKLSEADKRTTEISDNTSKISGSIDILNVKIKEMSENSNEREKLLNTIKMQAEKLRENIKNAKDINEDLNKAREGRKQITAETKIEAEKTTKDITEINKHTAIIESKTKELEEKIKNISNVNDKVQAISKKTDILALNAQVEAVKAKEGGEGFKVIANEIKSLADTASSSTEEIRRIFDEIEASLKDVKDSIKETKDNIISSQEQSAKTCAGLEKILDVTKTTSDIRNNMTNSINEGVLINQDLNKTIKEILEKTAVVSNLLIEQTNENEKVMKDVKDLDQITSKVSDDTNQIKEVIEKFIVESIKSIQTEIHRINDSMSQQDSATNEAVEAIKEIKQASDESRKQMKEINDVVKSLSKLFEEEEKGLINVGEVLEELKNINDNEEKFSTKNKIMETGLTNVYGN